MKKISLNGIWTCKPDREDIGIKSEWFISNNYNTNDNCLIDIKIPQSFNLLEGYDIFEGIFWHFYYFDLSNKKNIHKFDYQIRFKGSNYNTKIWLNGDFIGEHNGGFTPFFFNITRSIKENENLLVVRVDNIRRRNGIPALIFDWFNWGGIHRDVDLLILNKNRVKDVIIKTTLYSNKTSRIGISYEILGTLSLKWQILDGNQQNILLEDIMPKSSGNGKIVTEIISPKLWSPDSPYLYYLKLIDNSTEFKGETIYSSHFGIRQLEIQGVNLFLNKTPIKLKGVSLHEEYIPFGRTIPYKKRIEDIKIIKSLGFNSLRTAHYPHDEELLNIADQLGILVLEEIPLYWDCHYKSYDTFKLAAKMLRNLIKKET